MEIIGNWIEIYGFCWHVVLDLLLLDAIKGWNPNLIVCIKCSLWRSLNAYYAFDLIFCCFFYKWILHHWKNIIFLKEYIFLKSVLSDKGCSVLRSFVSWCDVMNGHWMSMSSWNYLHGKGLSWNYNVLELLHIQETNATFFTYFFPYLSLSVKLSVPAKSS